jgi:DHA1 family bicyclomycin/chloramphenicol resistance-like MFS transporter
MVIFVLVPAVAPLVGAWIMAGFGWRGIFPAFVVFAIVATGWFGARQAETLPVPARRPLGLGPLAAAVGEVLANRLVVMVTLVMALAFACLFATLSSTQQVFDQRFGLAESFPRWFAAIALISGLASLINARLVVTLGMRAMATGTLAAQAVNSGVIAGLFWAGLVPEWAAFWVYFYWTVTVFFMSGLTLGNLNALALEPMGHIAGTAASVITALATVLSVIVAVPIGLAFDGTPLPLIIGIFACTALSVPIMLALPRRKVQAA